MILDSSAAVSIVLEEEGSVLLEETLVAAESVAIGVPTMFETAMVLTAREGAAGRHALSALVTDNEIAPIPFDEHHYNVALEAFVRYGKGRHPARLNYGDCMTYATARLAERPLLYVGEDFAKTDLAPAVP